MWLQYECLQLYSLCAHLKVMKVGACSDGNLAGCVAFILTKVSVDGDFLYVQQQLISLSQGRPTCVFDKINYTMYPHCHFPHELNVDEVRLQTV